MSAPRRISQQIEAQITACAPALRLTTVRHLVTLVHGIAASDTCSLRRVAREVGILGLSGA